MLSIRECGSNLEQSRGDAASVPRGRIVCNCFEVSETDIRAAIGRGADLSALRTNRFDRGTARR
jgi:NAD(P)H-nitrite reductase large subunit